MKDVRIKKDVGTKLAKQEINVGKLSKQKIDFRNRKIPHFVTTFAQVLFQLSKLLKTDNNYQIES